MFKDKRFLIGAGVVGVIGLLLFFASLRIVPPGHVGVKAKFGQVATDELYPGLHFVNPVSDSVYRLDTRLVAYPVVANAASKDLQKVTTEVTLAHHLTPEMAARTFQKIGGLAELDAAVVSPGIQEAVKAVTAQYTAEELVTKRSKVKLMMVEAIQDYITKSLSEAGVAGALNVNNIGITDFRFSKEFDMSIEAKVKAEQEALKAENEKKTKITQAEADAESKKRAAEAEAYKTQKEAEARASAIRLEGEALKSNPALLQLRAIEKWKGNVPNVSAAGQVVPFINIDKMTEVPK